MYLNIYGTCEKCGTDLKAIDTVGYYDGRCLCSKCRALEPVTNIASAVIQMPSCEICGAPIPIYSSLYLTTGQRRCIACQGSIANLNIANLPTVSGSIGSTLSMLETGMFDVGKISIVNPRDEEIAKLKLKVEELEQTGHEDKEEVNKLKQRLAELEKGLSSSRDENVVSPSFDTVCQVLEFWIPRNVRRYEEAYKSELTEYLAHRFLQVREEARGGLCDILVAGQYPIHLKVSPRQSAYDILCGQIYRTLEDFGEVACVVVGIRSAERYHAFSEMIYSNTDPSRVRFFPKAR